MNNVWNLIDSQTLISGATWVDAHTSVKAKVFGKMVILAHDRVNYYHSDLFHDAVWLMTTLNGPMQFDWVARESGTFIGETANLIKDEDWPHSTRYRFEIWDENEGKKWMLNIYESIPAGDWRDEIPGTGINYYGQPVNNDDDPLDVSCIGYFDKGSLQHDGDTCPVHENLIGSTKGYWGTEEAAPFVGSEEMGNETEERMDLGAKYRDAMQEEFVLPEEFHPYFSNEPLPKKVVETVANPDVNPINAAVDLMFQKQSWVDRHAALDISECDVAFAVEGCIFHPAPVNGWTTMDHQINGTLEENPTPRNETELKTPLRKENKMDEILRDLREKLEEANNTKEQLEEYQGNINDAVDELDTYAADLENLIDNLDSLPEVSVYVDLDTVSFDS